MLHNTTIRLCCQLTKAHVPTPQLSKPASHPQQHQRKPQAFQGSVQQLSHHHNVKVLHPAQYGAPALPANPTDSIIFTCRSSFRQFQAHSEHASSHLAVGARTAAHQARLGALCTAQFSAEGCETHRVKGDTVAHWGKRSRSQTSTMHIPTAAAGQPFKAATGCPVHTDCKALTIERPKTSCIWG